MFPRLFAALLISISATGAMAQQATNGQQVPASAGQATPAVADPVLAAAFVTAASASNLVEIVSSDIALRRSANPVVRSFAENMINDHKVAQRQLKTSARADGVEFMPILSAEQEAKIEALNTVPEHVFDQTYLELQLTVHQRAVDLLGAYSANGSDGSLKVYAGATYPQVRTYLAKIEELLDLS